MVLKYQAILQSIFSLKYQNYKLYLISNWELQNSVFCNLLQFEMYIYRSRI